MPRVAPAVSLDHATKATLDRLVRSTSTRHGLVQRYRIILAAAAGKTNQQIAGDVQMPEVTVSKWRRRFASRGLEGLQDAARCGRPVKHGLEIVQRVQRRACQQPEHYSRWSVRTLAQDLRLPRSTVHQILVASHLQLHRIRTFTFSPDPDFEAKLLDIVGLYLNPPENALVLCVDEKTGIQALDRTQPLLPLSAKKPRSWSNEYVRHGTQTLLAALEIASGQVVAHVKQRRTSVNFLRFLKDVIAAFPEHELHMILDNLNIPQKRSRTPLVATASPRALPLHPDPRFLGQYGGMFLQHSGQAGAIAKCPYFEAPAKGISGELHRPQQRESQAVRMDQRTGEAPAYYRGHEGISSGAPAQAKEASTNS